MNTDASTIERLAAADITPVSFGGPGHPTRMTRAWVAKRIAVVSDGMPEGYELVCDNVTGQVGSLKDGREVVRRRAGLIGRTVDKWDPTEGTFAVLCVVERDGSVTVVGRCKN